MNLLAALRILGRSVFGPNADAREGARYALLDACARRLGFRLYNRNLAWVDDDEYRAAWQAFRPGDWRVKDRKYVAWSMANSVADLSGDTAECGVFDGGTSHLICLARERAERSSASLHHVFDSFAGLSEPKDADRPTDAAAYVWQAGDLAVPLEQVKQNLRRFDFVRYHRGWIPERFGEVADRSFAFVHVDVDLYQPTYDSLAFFYERLLPGGILLCDDYGSTLCPGAMNAFDELVRERPEGRVVHLTTGQGFIVKRARDGV